VFATAKALDQPYEPLSAEFLIGQIPFTVFDAVNISRAKIPTAKALQTQLGAKAVAKPEKEYVPPPSSLEEQAQLEKVFVNLAEVTQNEASTPQEREAALAAALGVVKDPKVAVQLKAFKQTGEMDL